MGKTLIKTTERTKSKKTLKPFRYENNKQRRIKRESEVNSRRKWRTIRISLSTTRKNQRRIYKEGNRSKR